jgi:hypothetical protein
MRQRFRLIAIKEGSNMSWGYATLGCDKETVTRIGAWVKLDGTAGIHEARVIKHDPDRKLLYVKHSGYTSYLGRGTGNAYSPARFVVYEYAELAHGNEIHLYVDLFGIAELPMKWSPPNETHPA